MNDGERDSNNNNVPDQPDHDLNPPQHFTFWSEIRTCLSSPILVTISLGFAAIMAVSSSLITFGGSLVLALQLFDDEREASTAFGVSAALAGIIGMPIGGHLVDRIMTRHAEGGSYFAILASLLPVLNGLMAMATTGWLCLC